MVYLYENIEQLTDHQLFLLENSLPKSLRERAEQIRHRKRKAERIVGYSLLCHALSAQYGLSRESLSVMSGKYGKLFLAAPPDIFFNISHSDENAVCIVGRRENGIDLQKRIAFQEKIKARICAEQEEERVDLCPTIEEKEWTLTKIWAAKEAYLKKKGTGITRDLRLLCTEEEKEGQYAVEGETVYLYKREDLILAVCTGEERETVCSVTFEELQRQNERKGRKEEKMGKKKNDTSVKTNAMRIVESAKVPFRTKEYEVDEEDLSGVHAAQMIGMECGQVFKTLVLKGERTGYFVCCIPVDRELDLKKVAKAAGDKKAEMIPMKDLLPVTGYIRGGCSPVGMKKKFPTYFDETAQLFDEIAVSAGKRGEQIVIHPEDLRKLVEGTYADLVRE